MSKRLLLPALLLTSLLILSACASDGPGGNGNQKTYKIGVITALTGGSGEMGQEQKRVLEFRANELNSINNYQIELVFHDGQCEVGAAAATMKKLTKEEGVPFVIGGLCTEATFAAVPVTEDKQSILLSATVNNEHLEGLSPNAFTLAFPESALARAVADELQKYHKVATLSEIAENSGLLEKVLDDLLFAEYPEIPMVYDERFEPGATNLDELITKLKDTGADVVFLNPDSEASALAVLQAIDRAGLKIAMIGQTVFTRPDVLVQMPESAEGMLIIQPPRIADEKFADYKAKIETTGQFKLLDDYQIAATLDALDLLAKLVSENAGDVESVQKALSTGTFSGFVGKIHFGGKAFSANSQVSRQKIENRRLVAE